MSSIKVTYHCLSCNTQFLPKKNTFNKYCNNACQQKYQQSKVFEKVINGEAENFKQVKRYLLSIDNRCSVCGIHEWQNNPISLELDHVDGNPYNNKLTNCRLICPNCHSQTETYKAKNKGNGRHERMKRYHEGKSF